MPVVWSTVGPVFPDEAVGPAPLIHLAFCTVAAVFLHAHCTFPWWSGSNVHVSLFPH